MLIQSKLLANKRFFVLFSTIMLSIGTCNASIKIINVIDFSIRNVINQHSNTLTGIPEMFIEFSQLRATDDGLYIPYRICTTKQEVSPAHSASFFLPDNEFREDQPIFITERLTIGSLNLSRRVTINIGNGSNIDTETVLPITIQINENGTIDIATFIAIQKQYVYHDQA